MRNKINLGEKYNHKMYVLEAVVFKHNPSPKHILMHPTDVGMGHMEEEVEMEEVVDEVDLEGSTIKDHMEDTPPTDLVVLVGGKVEDLEEGRGLDRRTILLREQILVQSLILISTTMQVHILIETRLLLVGKMFTSKKVVASKTRSNKTQLLL
eukprot:96290_1